VSEVKPQGSPTIVGEQERQLMLQICGQEYSLTGHWNWDISADTLLCSDALISLPPHADYVRCLVHPDDVQDLRDALQEGLLSQLQFRVVTNSGAVKEVEGLGISVQTADFFSTLLEEERQAAYEGKAARQRLADLQHRAAAANSAEKDLSTGTWWFNSTTGEMHYSDGIFRIHGLPAQSLNPHPQTFSPFIHADDVAIVTDTLLEALRRRIPLELHYRIYTGGGSLRFVRLRMRWAFMKKDRRSPMARCRIAPMPARPKKHLCVLTTLPGSAMPCCA
jgi:hypothetical protein